MRIAVNCPQCSRLLQLPSETIGRSAKCPICQTTFLTRDLGNDKAEAIPLAGPDDSPDRVPSRARPGNIPELSLDEEIPEAPLLDAPRRGKSPPPPPADKPRRRPRDEEPPRRRERDREDRDDRRRGRDDDRRDPDEDRPRKRARTDAKFAALIHRDPAGRLEGRFDADVSADGLRFWRGRGRTLEVPTGVPVRHLGGARLSVPVEGRDVELAVIDPQGRSRLLAEEIAAFFKGDVDRVALPAPPKKRSGAVAWVPLAALGIPLLAFFCGNAIGGWIGAVVWLGVALLVGGIAALFVFANSWAPATRGGWAGACLAVGYLALGIGFLFDRPGVPSSAWKEFAPSEGGFAAALPGEPAPNVWPCDDLRGMGVMMYHAETPGYAFDAGAGEFKPTRAGQQPNNNLKDRLDALRKSLNPYLGNLAIPRYSRSPAVDAFTPLPNTKAREYEGRLPDGRYTVARLTASGSHVLVLGVTSPYSISRESPEVRRFFDSAKPAFVEDRPVVIDKKDGGKKDGDKKDGDKKDGDKKDPPKTEDIGLGGKLLAKGAELVWVGWTPNGNELVTVARAGRVRAYDVNGKEVASFSGAANGGATGAALSPDGRRLAVTASDGNLRIIDRAGHKLEKEYDMTRLGAPWCVAWSPDGKTIATGHPDHKVRLYDVEKNMVRTTLDAGEHQVVALAYAPDGRYLASGNGEREVYVFDTRTDKPVANWTAHDRPKDPDDAKDWRHAIGAMAFAADCHTLATAGHDRQVFLWDASTGKRGYTYGTAGVAHALAFFPSGRLLASGSVTGHIALLDPARQNVRTNVRLTLGGDEVVHSLAFDPAGDRLAVALGDRLGVYSIDRQTVTRQDRVPLAAVPLPPLLPKNLTRFEAQANGEKQSLKSLQVSGNGSRFTAAAHPSRALLVYGESDLKLQNKFTLGFNAPATALSPSGALLARQGETRILLASTRDGFEQGELRPSGEGTRAATRLAFSADGKRLASAHPRFGQGAGQVHLFDVTTKAELRAFDVRAAPESVSLSPDGLSVAVACAGDKLVRLHSAATGREYAGAKGHDAAVKHVLFSPDGKWIASADADGGVRLFDAAKARQAFALAGHRPGVAGLAFSPDSKTLAIGSEKAVKIWDVPSGKLLTTLDHDATVVGLGFGPDGNSLIVGSSETINRWDLREIAELKNRPAPATLDLSKSPAPELPELELVGLLEPHLCRAVDARAGALLLFTRDRLCLHYSYPELSFRGAHHTGALIHRAALDGKGNLFAATADAASLAPRPFGGGWTGKGPLLVFDVKDLLAGKNAAGRLKAKATIEAPGEVYTLDLAAGGKAVCFLQARAAGLNKPTLRRIDAGTFQPLEPLDIDHAVTAAGTSPDGTLYLAGRQAEGAKGFVLPIDLAAFQAGKLVETEAPAASIDAGDKRLLLGGMGINRSEVHLLDRSSTKLPTAGRLTDAPKVSAAQVTGDRVVLLLGQTTSRSLHSYDRDDAERGKAREALARFAPGKDDALGNDLDLLPDGKRLISGSGHVVRVGPPAPPAKGTPPARRDDKLRPLTTWREGPHRALALTWSADGARLVSAGSGRRQAVWTVATGKFLVGLTAGGNHGLAHSPAEEAWAIANWDGAVTLLRPNTKQSKVVKRANTGEVAGVAITPDGKHVVIASGKKVLQWQVDGPPVTLNATAGGRLTCLGVAGPRVAVAGDEGGELRVFDLRGHEEVASLKGHDGEVRAAAVSRDGKRAVSGGVDGKVRVWDVSGKKETHALDQGAAVLSVALAPDGKLIASGGIDGSLALWDAETGKQLAAAAARPGLPVYALAFSADGKTLAAAAGPEVRRYDTAALAGKPLALGDLELPKKEEKKDPVVPKKGDASEVANLSPFVDALADAKAGYILTVSPQQFLRQHSYPEFAHTGTYKLDADTLRLALDRDGKSLYAFRGETKKKAPGAGRLYVQKAEVVVYDSSELEKPKGGKMRELPVRRRIELPGDVVGFALAPDGKALYCLDASRGELVKIDAESKKKLASVAVGKGATALFLTGDGKTLYVASEDGEKGKVQRFDAALKARDSHDLAFAPAALAATDAGHLLLTGVKSKTMHAVELLDAEKQYKTLYRSAQPFPPSIKLAPDQSVFYLAPSTKILGGLVRRIDAVKDTRVSKGVFMNNRLSSGGELFVSPDGLYLGFAETGRLHSLGFK